jgi:hypothetical protein
LNDEDIAGLHLQRRLVAERLAPTVGALDPVSTRRAWLTAREAERRDAPTIGQQYGRHGREEAHAPIDAVAATKATLAT